MPFLTTQVYTIYSERIYETLYLVLIQLIVKDSDMHEMPPSTKLIPYLNCRLKSIGYSGTIAFTRIISIPGGVDECLVDNTLLSRD